MKKNLNEYYWDEAGYITLEGALKYKCKNDLDCQEALKFAVIKACTKGKIKYSASDGRDKPHVIRDLVKDNVLMIHWDSFKTLIDQIDHYKKSDDWVDSLSNRCSHDTPSKNPTKSQISEPINQRLETTYLNIIGAMLDIFISQKYGEKKFSSQSKLVTFIVEKYDGFDGLKKRTIDEKFATAKRSLESQL